MSPGAQLNREVGLLFSFVPMFGYARPLESNVGGCQMLKKVLAVIPSFHALYVSRILAPISQNVIHRSFHNIFRIRFLFPSPIFFN